MVFNIRPVVIFLGFILRLADCRAQNNPPANTQFLLGGFENVNPTHVNGVQLYEGDILLTEEQRKQLLDRKAIAKVSMRWPNGQSGTPVVPYKFGDELVNREAVEAGLAHWEEHTCIDFQEITSIDPAKYLNFIQDSGCWSNLGMQSKPQNISIEKGCDDLGTVVHEVGHALGLYHEQSRSDRDDYVSVLYENIEDDKKINFEKVVDNNYSVPYDLASDMHYGSNFFSINGKNTITTKYPLVQGLIGIRNGLTHYDKLLANMMYPCISKWMQICNIATNPCQNDGYVGKDCQCVCRSGTIGTHCQTVYQGYYDSLISPCSENVTTPGPVTSPSYPNNSPAGVRCVKWIQAPDCNTVKIKFNYFKLYRKVSQCVIDRLEIRTTNLTVGDVYCDNEITVGTEFTSPSNQMILYFETITDDYSGWSADVKFIPTASCYPKGSVTGIKQLPSMSTASSFLKMNTRNQTDNCHQLINTVDVGTTGMITPPSHYAWKRQACEFWIRSPAGTRIKLTFAKPTTNTTCTADKVVVNKAGDVTYHSDGNSKYCGTTFPAPVISTANTMNVLFFRNTDNEDFNITWSVI